MYLGEIRLQNHAGHHQLVQNVIHPVEVVNQVQFTDVFEASVQNLDEDLDERQRLDFNEFNSRHLKCA